MKQLYSIPIPDATMTGGDGDSVQADVLSEGMLEGGGAVDQLSSDPSTTRLEGQFRGRLADVMVRELEELVMSSDFDALPMHSEDNGAYYTTENVSVEPLDPRTGQLQSFNVDLRERGTRGSHYRRLATNPRMVDHSFGNDMVHEVALPSAARKVMWFDPDSRAREVASSVRTVSAEFGDLDIYDLEASPLNIEYPDLIFDVPYDEEQPLDARVYDTRGEDDKIIEADGDTARQWASVYSTRHDVTNEVVLDNGITRVRLDENGGGVNFQKWTGSQWETTPHNQPVSVTLVDVDVTSIGMVRDVVQLAFDVSGSLYELNVIVEVGMEDPLFEIPDVDAQGSIPQDLADWLSPLADTSIVDTQAAKTLVGSNEVRRR